MGRIGRIHPRKRIALNRLYHNHKPKPHLQQTGRGGRGPPSGLLADRMVQKGVETLAFRGLRINMPNVKSCLIGGLLVISMTLSAQSKPAPTAVKAGGVKPVSFPELSKQFANPDNFYGPFAFWFWDEPLQAGKASKQAASMMTQGLNPGYAHGRISIQGGPGLPDAQWLGPEWWREFSSALKTTTNAGGYLGYVDEYMWPCLQANGRTVKQHPELKAESLIWRTMDVKGGQTASIPTGYAAIAAPLTQNLKEDEVTDVRPTPPLGQWIWHKNTRDNTVISLYHTVSLPKPAVDVSVIGSCDNSFVLSLNGKQVLEGKNWASPSSTSLKRSFEANKPIQITVQATNLDLAAGFVCALRFGHADGSSTLVQSDGTWTASETAGGAQSAVTVIGPSNTPPWNLGTDMAGMSEHKPRTIRSKGMVNIKPGSKWAIPAGNDWRIYVFYKNNHNMVNYLDRQLGPKYAKIGLEPYAQKYRDQMGKGIPGDFADNEGDYGSGLAWSGDLEKDYKRRFKVDVKTQLPLLVDKDVEGRCAAVRFRWFDVMTDLYSGTFQYLSDWHQQYNMYVTGHFWEESLQAVARWSGHNMKMQRAFSMPGQDNLQLNALNPHDFMEAHSVAEWEGRRFMAEYLGAASWEPFQPDIVKQSTNSMFAWGTSHVIPHGVFMYEKMDGNPWTPDFSEINPFFPWMHLWTDVVRRASYVNSHGQQVISAVVYYPIESVWANTDSNVFDVNNNPTPANFWSLPNDRPENRRMNHINEVYSKALDQMARSGVQFLVADSPTMARLKLNGAQLTMGNRRVSAVVLPPLDVMPLKTMQQLVGFVKAGGHVYALGELPNGSTENGLIDAKMAALCSQLSALPGYHRMPGEIQAAVNGRMPGLSPCVLPSDGHTLLQHHRRIDGKEFYYLANNGAARKMSLTFPGAKGSASVWDIESGKTTPINSVQTATGSQANLNFELNQAYYVVFDPAKPANTTAPKPLSYSPVMTVEGDWLVRFDPNDQPPLEHKNPVNPALAGAGNQKPLGNWTDWGMASFSGRLNYRKQITVTDVPAKCVLDLGTVYYAAEVTVNGKKAGMRLWAPYRFDVSGLLQPGVNTIEVRVANLINNSYGTHKPGGLMGPVRLLQGK